MLNSIVWNRTDYLYKMDLALNNLQRLICHKTQTNSEIFQEWSEGRDQRVQETEVSLVLTRHKVDFR